MLADQLPDHSEEVASLYLNFFGGSTKSTVLDILSSESVQGLANNFADSKESLLTVGTLVEGVSNLRDLGAQFFETDSGGPVNGAGLNLVTHSKEDLTVLAGIVKVSNEVGVVELKRVNPVAESAFLS